MSNPAIAFYIGGFEAIGGIESCFADLLTAFDGAAIDRSLFVWADDLPQLRALAASGARVHRTALRAGCRWDLPDWLLLMRHGAQLGDADKIVFGKIPPRRVFQRMLAMLDRRPGGRPELLYITAYRPSELWKDRVPDWLGEAIDTMIVQSPDFTADLRAMGYGGRIVEIPYLPPMASTVPDPDRSRDGVCRLGFLGRFVPQKNLSYLLDILDRMRGDAVELHLFGEGEHDASLRATVAARGLPAIFHGPVERAAVPAAIDSCDIFLNPSISEGQCLVALEVLSRGRPFVGSPVGAIPQILSRGRFGEIVPLDDATAAAGVVRDMVAAWRSDAWNPSAIVTAYRAAYDPDAIAARYFDLFTGPSRRTEPA